MGPSLEFINQASAREVFTAMKVKFLNEQKLYEGDWQKLVKRSPTSSLIDKEINLMNIPGPRPWNGGREYRDIALSGYEIVTSQHELTIHVGVHEWKALDFNRGQLLDIPTKMLQNTMQTMERSAWTQLINGGTILGPDGLPLFSANHVAGEGLTQSNDMGGAGPAWYLVNMSSVDKPVKMSVFQEPEVVFISDPQHPFVFEKKKYVWGLDYRIGFGYGAWQTIVRSKQTLDDTNFDLALERYMQLQDESGFLLNMGVMPTLVVPVVLRREALQVVTPLVPNGGTNINANVVPVLVTPMLPNT